MTVYTPSPASVPDRALAYLRSLPIGAEIVGAALAEGAHVPIGGLKANMQGPLNAGVVFARQKGGSAKSPLFWSLVDHSRPAAVFPRSVFEPAPALNGARFTLNLKTGEVSSPAVGSQDSNGEAKESPAKAGQEPRALRDAVPTTPHDGQPDDAQRVHASDQHEHAPELPGHLTALRPSPDASNRRHIPEALDLRHVLKAEAARPDATDREIPVTASPVGGPMGVWQPAAAGPLETPVDEFDQDLETWLRSHPPKAKPPRFAIDSNWALTIDVPGEAKATISRDAFSVLVRFLDSVRLDHLRETP